MRRGSGTVGEVVPRCGCRSNAKLIEVPPKIREFLQDVGDLDVLRMPIGLLQ